MFRHYFLKKIERRLKEIKKGARGLIAFRRLLVRRTTQWCVMSNLQVIGQKIKYYRRMKSMTQKELATELRVASSYIANIEQGQKGISLDKLVDFCRYLNIGLSDLLPIQNESDSVAKEEIIRETVDLLRGLETTQIQMVKTMVAGVVFPSG